MTTALSISKLRFASWREWELNPVLLKELRQAVRSRVLAGTLMLLLTVLLLISLLFLGRHGFSAYERQQLGLPLFCGFLFILMTVTLIFVPLYIASRMALERRKSDPDLMFFTPLPPARIVKGKLMCGAYLALMFFSVCMPFMAFTNLLRGIDLPTIFFILIRLFFVVCVAIQAAILLGSLPIGRVGKAVLGVLFVFGLLIAFSAFLGLFFSLLRTGVGGSPWFWIKSVIILLAMLGILGVLFLTSVSALTTGRRAPGFWDETTTVTDHKPES